jgi:hypothetical protein
MHSRPVANGGAAPSVSPPRVGCRANPNTKRARRREQIGPLLVHTLGHFAVQPHSKALSPLTAYPILSRPSPCNRGNGPSSTFELVKNTPFGGCAAGSCGRMMRWLLKPGRREESSLTPSLRRERGGREAQRRGTAMTWLWLVAWNVCWFFWALAYITLEAKLAGGGSPRVGWPPGEARLARFGPTIRARPRQARRPYQHRSQKPGAQTLRSRSQPTLRADPRSLLAAKEGSDAPQQGKLSALLFTQVPREEVNSRKLEHV